MRLLQAAALLAACTPLVPAAASAARRPLRPADVLALKDVGDPQLSPDGQWVAFTVRSLRAKEDDADVDVYMVPFAGGDALRVTASDKSETRPRFSPDGRYLAFLSARDGKRTQVSLLDRRGGEGAKLTDYPGSVSDLAWSPDGKHLALVVSDADPNAPAEDADDEDQERPRPIVITRRQFKRDGEGYLTDVRSHIYAFDVVRKTSVQLTSGPYDDSAPAWSPDGKHVAFVSNRTPDPDSNQNADIFVVAATGGPLRRLVDAPGEDAAPVFSPDGTLVAFLQGGDPRDLWYAPNHVAVIPFAGGAVRALTASLDRNVYAPRFSPNGASLLFLLEDGGNSHLARVAVAGGAVERVLPGERDVQAFDVASKGAQIAVLESRPQMPFEVSAVEGGDARRLSHVNDAFLGDIALASVERFETRSADGTRIQGFLTRPPGAAAGARLPTILRIHGGPVAQYSTAFELEWQMLAAHGYAVVAANPRGSSGYGRDFSRAIWADWGNKDYDDVTAAVDHVIGRGVADQDRLGVGGWSYGGILTDYIVTRTGRFKAAISGASETNYLANYGTDHYQYEWETELGLPWQNRELWMRLSPWFSVEKVTTPTLLLCGADDQNVPLVNSEQFYQALRRLGRETELVIYPGATHDIERPSFLVDRFQRYLAWYDKYLKPGAAAAVAPAEATSLLGGPLARPPLGAQRRATLEADLASATAAFVKTPDDADAILWLGRRTAYLGRFREAIDIYTRGLARHPRDPRFYRHRGHRYLTLREIDQAEADLARAAELIRGTPDAVEPDGAPNAANVPTSTLHFNVWYHLGLARYLKADFAGAARAYRECLATAKDSADRLVAASDWLYLTLRRQGRTAEAAALLAPITADLEVIENTAYRNRLLLYAGTKTADELRRSGTTPVDAATYGYGVAAWHLVNGRAAEAKALLETVAASEQWPAFAVLAAEAELARMR